MDITSKDSNIFANLKHPKKTKQKNNKINKKNPNRTSRVVRKQLSVNYRVVETGCEPRQRRVTLK